MLQAPRIVRWTLPALLLMLVAGAIFIVAASGREDVGRPAAPDAAGTSTPARQGQKPKRIAVREGDTAESIARRADLTVIRLLKLNPNVDPRSLRAGQRLKIAP